jgi:hypothetical protein
MIQKHLNRLEQIDYLVRNKATGNPKEMAKKLGISERAWYKLRDELIKDLNFPIAYCSIQRTYYYTASGKFEVGFKYLTEKQKENLKGGWSYKPEQLFFINNFSKIFSPLHF